jgi:hypothetical protein
MRRAFLCLFTAVLFPAFASAQEPKQESTPGTLDGYVSLCLTAWEGAPDLRAKVAALGLQDVTGSAGATITVGKASMQFYRSPQGDTVGTTFTTFADGKDWSCDINLRKPVDRTVLDAMETALDLDGQLVAMGPVTMGRWKFRKRQPVVLVKAIATQGSTIIMVQKFEAAPPPAPANARAKQTH